jgi:uracil-DNA glycosylase
VGLDEVYDRIRDDPRWDYLRLPGIRLVPGRGDAFDPMAMVVGEAPGANENLKGKPFVGVSGKVLDQLMESAGLYSRDIPLDYDGQEPSSGIGAAANAFITNVLKYRPMGNRTPNAREILFGLEALREEWMAIGRPRLIVAVGAPARSALTPVELRLQPGDWVALKDGKTFIYVQYHPQWGLRNGKRGRDTMERQWAEMGTWIRESGMF